ncbi:hypothetical protein BDN67DRAFT_992462 [Paxillus ammoniavirescens]|nr:hypothetical protein BDN67DRAFT_992462 [Paxillus ammoniavirescens]
MVYIAVGHNFHETHNTLQDMLNQQGGGFEWSKGHNSHFETSKFGLMDFSRNRTKEQPPMNIKGTLIKPATSHCFLGVLVDMKGVPLSLMMQLYTSVALPKMLYTVDLWLTHLYVGETDSAQRGSIGTVNKMKRVQRLAVTSITRALKTTATDAMEVHAKLLPISYRIQNHCHQAVLCISAHLKTHPAARIYVRHHRSSLHHLTHTFRINLNNDGRIGSVAVLYNGARRPRILRYHLGMTEEHTVYESEVVGLSLAIHLLVTERDLELPVAIYIDSNQWHYVSG